MVCVPCARCFATRQSNDTSESTSTGEPVASLLQLRVLKRLSPVCAPLKLVDSSQSSARSTFTQNTLPFSTALCVVASLFTQISTVGGSAVAEHTAVAVMPYRWPACALVMMLTAPASERMPTLNCSTSTAALPFSSMAEL